MCFTCCNCDATIQRQGRRGPPPKRCDACRREAEAASRAAKKVTHQHTCEQCGVVFFSGKKKQRCCTDTCRAAWVKIRAKQRNNELSSAPCRNPSCNNRRKRNGAYCSKACYKRHVRGPDKFCQNPACGKKINRPHQGSRKKTLGRDSLKYCCRSCYHDDRWGLGRPRKKWGESHVRQAASVALRTSLRKKCKLLCVPYDEECTRQAVCDRDNWCCQNCGIKCNREYVINPKTRRIHPRNAEHDHIIPLTREGSPGNVFPNSQCLCRKCNNRKSDRSKGQMRLDIEGSVERWENGARSRRRRNSRSSVAIPAAVL